MYALEKQRAILKYLKENAYKMCREPSGNFTKPYVEPGAVYISSLWDWDSRFGVEALFDITEKLKGTKDFDYEKTKAWVIECGKGCIINFFDKQLEDGFLPIGVFNGDDWVPRMKENHKARKVNHVKPVIAQFIKMVADYSNDFTFFDLEKVEKYFDYYDKYQKDEWTGLYVWQNDLMIGIDNNPTVFFRPPLSSADIYLNTFMVEDLNCFSYILEKLGNVDRANYYKEKSKALSDLINKEMYDERDAYYYSQDVIVDRQVEQMGYHHGFPLENKGLPIKIRVWAGLMPLWAGIPTQNQANAIIEKNFSDDTLFCKAGIRSLASNEKMFDERSSNNPSNHVGPVWTINNVITWKGLKRYGFTDLAEELRRRTIDMLGDSVINDGGFYESYRCNGEHMLFCGFLSWNCLVSEMLDEGIEI